MTKMIQLDVQDELLHYLRGASKGDQSAFQRLYERTSSRMYAVALRLLRRRDWADEVMQEAYVRIWHNASEYLSDRGAVLTWMISILRYRAIDRLRKEKSHLSLDEQDMESEAFAADDDLQQVIQQAQDAQLLHGCMNELKDVQRNSIAAAFFEGLTHEQLSARLDVPLGTVKSWIRRGLLLLRRCLER